VKSPSIVPTHFDEVLDKVLADFFLVPLGNVLDDDLSLFESAVAQEPAGALGHEPPVTRTYVWKKVKGRVF
jgi:hypothetical protein